MNGGRSSSSTCRWASSRLRPRIRLARCGVVPRQHSANAATGRRRRAAPHVPRRGGVSPSSRRCRSGRCGRMTAKASAGAGKPTWRDWRHPCNGSNFCRLTWADSVSTRAPTFAAMRRGASCGEVVMRGRTRVRLLRGDRCPPTHARHPRVPARAPGPARAVSPAIRRVRAGASGWRRPAAQRRCARRGVAAVAMDFCCVASSLPHDNCIDAGRGSSVGRIRRRTFPT